VRKRSRKFTPPAVTTPATIYLVRWLDANYDTEHDGPSADYAAELVQGFQVGFHVQNQPGLIVLAGESAPEDGVNHSRFHLTVPTVHITHMIPWADVPNIMASAEEVPYGDPEA
jgi:hypothetical protein